MLLTQYQGCRSLLASLILSPKCVLAFMSQVLKVTFSFSLKKEISEYFSYQLGRIMSLSLRIQRLKFSERISFIFL